MVYRVLQTRSKKITVRRFLKGQSRQDSMTRNLNNKPLIWLAAVGQMVLGTIQHALVEYELRCVLKDDVEL